MTPVPIQKILLKTPGLKFIQLLLFIVFIFVQIFVDDRPFVAAKDIPPAINAERISALALGEGVIAAKLLEYWLLGFDSASGEIVSYNTLNYDHLADWLLTIQKLDPLSDYPSLMASGVYIEVKDKQRARRMIEFVNQNFLRAPERRWRWQAQIVMHAKYRLKDLPLARELAENLRHAAKNSDVILPWARDLEFLVLQDMGEFEAAVMLIDRLLTSGEITDADELRFLTAKLKELQHRQIEKTSNSHQR